MTIAVVTKPFSFEGAQRSKIANEALVRLKEKVDTLIVVSNDRIFSVIQKETPIIRAFEVIDEVLLNSVQGIAESIAMHGIINVDFADVKTIMQDAGPALVGIGFGSGADRAINAVNQAIHSPLVEASIDGARGILFVVAGSRDLKMNEINDAAKIVSDNIDPSAKFIFGAYHDRKVKNRQLKVTIIATGFNGNGVGNLVKDNGVATTSLFNQPLALNNREDNNNNKEFKERKEENGKKEVKQKETKDSDIWDIPTFLRKKKK